MTKEEVKSSSNPEAENMSSMFNMSVCFMRIRRTININQL